MNDEVSRLRSVAFTPDLILQWEKDEWKAAVAALSRDDFDALMAPLLDDGRKGLISLPEWSRTHLAARWLSPQ